MTAAIQPLVEAFSFYSPAARSVFTDGDEWAITPPSHAASDEESFLLPVAEVSRSPIASSYQPRGAGALCRDDLGLEYSPEAVVRIGRSVAPPREQYRRRCRSPLHRPEAGAHTRWGPRTRVT